MTHDEAIDALCGCAATVTVLSYQEAIEGYLSLRGISLDALMKENAALKSARNLAYGFLWRMSIDRRKISDDLAYRAREALLATMEKSDQADGIEDARAAIAKAGGAS